MYESFALVVSWTPVQLSSLPLGGFFSLKMLSMAKTGNLGARRSKNSMRLTSVKYSMSFGGLFNKNENALRFPPFCNVSIQTCLFPSSKISTRKDEIFGSIRNTTQYPFAHPAAGTG